MGDLGSLPEKLRVRNDTLYIENKPLSGHRVTGLLGSGANGFVFRTHNDYLDRDEALKVWLKLKPADNRDKIKQGIAEAKRAIAASPDHSATIYTAGVHANVFYASMQLIPGPSIKQQLACIGWERDVDQKNRLSIVREYVSSLKETTTRDFRHGDPHWGNAILNTPGFDESGFIRSPRHLKPLVVFVDYGTSLFTKRGESESRHWRIVEREVERLIGRLPRYQKAKQDIEEKYRIVIGDPLRLAFYDELIEQTDPDEIHSWREPIGFYLDSALKDRARDPSYRWYYWPNASSKDGQNEGVLNAMYS